MESTPLIQSDSSVKTTTRYFRLVVVNLILCVWTLAEKVHSPVVSQYLYLRMKEQVYPNGSVSETQNITCYQNTSSENFRLQEKAQQMTNALTMHFSLSKAGAELIVCTVLGSFSDYVGRKVLFLIPTFGYLVKTSVLTAIIHWHLDVNLYYISELAEGVTGGVVLFNLAAYVCVSDNTPAKGSRTLWMIVVDMTIALAGASVSTATGIFIKQTGFFYPSLTSALLTLTVIIIVVFVFSNDRKREAVSVKNLITSVKNVFSVFFVEGSRKMKVSLWLAGAVYFLTYICENTGDIGTLWQLNFPLCWDSEMIGYYSMASTIFKQVLALPIMKISQLILRDEVFTIFSSLVSMSSSIIHAMATTNWLMYTVAIVAGLAVTVTAIIRAILSRMTSPDRQGSLMASLAVFHILSKCAADPMFSSVYRSTVLTLPGTVYYIAAGMYLACACVCVVFAVASRGLAVDWNSKNLNIQEDHARTNSE